ncbi:MAG: hypothetical protein Q4D74_07410 [Comamonadaceae bacterium]|nr:hypothetical protein [Comamonadaceae bacterium]
MRVQRKRLAHARQRCRAQPQGSMNKALSPASCSGTPACRSRLGSDCMAMVLNRVWLV